MSKPVSPVVVRERLIDLMRRDLIGPHPDLDPDLAREILSGSSPSNWYLTGYLGPQRKTGAAPASPRSPVPKPPRKKLPRICSQPSVAARAWRRGPRVLEVPPTMARPSARRCAHSNPPRSASLCCSHTARAN
jgi:hypothetical protein